MAADEKQQKHPTLQEVVEEVKRMTDIGFPIATMGLVGYLKNMISVICMGRLGSLELAAGSLAIGLTNITGYSVLSGLAMGMDPLCSQAFGSHNSSLALSSLQTTISILLFASVPISMIWINLNPLMIFLHQNPEITQIATLYCRFSLPDLIINSLLHPLRIYLRNRGITWPLMWCTLLAIFFHFPITFVLTFHLGLGVKGIAISTFVTNFNTLFFLLIYIFFSFTPKHPLHMPLKPKSPTPICSKINKLGGEWMILIKFAIPSCLGVCLEWWWYELMTILAGYLYNPKIALATSAIMIQTTSIMYTLPSALSASVCTRVGRELGAGRPGKAHLATSVAISLAFISSFLGLSWTTLGKEMWGEVFTKDVEVLKLTRAVLPIIGICEIANCPQTTSVGVLRGSARPAIGALINFCSFYLVGAPLGIVLAFVWELGFLGLCYGLLAAQITCLVSILIVVYHTNWEAESMKAKDLVGKDDELFGHQIQGVVTVEEAVEGCDT